MKKITVILMLLFSITIFCKSQTTTYWTQTGNTILPDKWIGTKNFASFRIKTNGLERMVLDSNGYTGIGTNNPKAKLHVFSSGIADNMVIDGTQYPALRFYGNGNQYGAFVLEYPSPAGFNVAQTNELSIVSNVGINLGKPSNLMMKVNDNVSIGGGGASAPNCSMFSVFSLDKTRGAMPCPALTTAQRDAIVSPVDGLQVWNTQTLSIDVFSALGNTWVKLTGQKRGTQTITTNGSQTTFFIPHGIGYTPSCYSMFFSDGSNTYFANSTRDADNSYLIITCPTAPPTGTIKVMWTAYN